MYNGRSGREELQRYRESHNTPRGVPPAPTSQRAGSGPPNTPPGALNGAGGANHFSGLLGRLTGGEARSGRRSPPQALALPPSRRSDDADPASLYSNRDGSPRRAVGASWGFDEEGASGNSAQPRGGASPSMDDDSMQQIGELNSALGRIDSLLSKYS